MGRFGGVLVEEPNLRPMQPAAGGAGAPKFWEQDPKVGGFWSSDPIVKKPRFAGTPVDDREAVPPPGLKPGSKEYADWAVQQAKAGKTLPQVSPTPPEAAPYYGPDSPETRAVLAPALAANHPWTGSYASEAMSGVNEGLANAASLPTMLANAALSIGPAAANFVMPPERSLSDLVTGEEPKPRFAYPNYVPDPGAALESGMETIGAIQPARDEPGKKFVRRVGQEVGASLPFGLTRPVATIATAIGSGTGAATAEQVAPDNPWAELAGQLVGGGATGVIGAAAKKMAASGASRGASPSADDLQMLKNQAYQVADGLGVKYTPGAYQGLVAKTDAAMKAGNLSPTRHPKAYSFLEDMKARASGQYGQGLSLTELDQLRQEVRRDLIQSSDLSERHFGKIIMRQIDEMIATAGPNDVAAGSGQAANEAILAARELNTRFRKTEIVEDAMYAANLKAAAAGSGGNINNAIRQAFKSILLDKDTRAAFTAAEISEMERIVKQGKGEELLRLVGKLSPGGNGLMTMLGIGGTVLNPTAAVIPVAGMVAKGISDRWTVTRATNLRADIARGANPKTVAPIPAQSPVPLVAAGIGAAANQNDRTKAPALPAYLRATAFD